MGIENASKWAGSLMGIIHGSMATAALMRYSLLAAIRAVMPPKLCPATMSLLSSRL